jgi:hypothetical protein
VFSLFLSERPPTHRLHFSTRVEGNIRSRVYSIQMPLTAQSLSLFNNAALTQAGVNLLPQFPAPYREGVSYTKRTPNCQRCGQHGRKARLKGHKRVCPFKDCTCAKCQVVAERQKLMADQIKIRRRQRKDNLMSMTRENLKALNAVAAAANDNLPYINNLNMLCKQIADSSDAKQPSLLPNTSLASFALSTMGAPLHSASSVITTTATSTGAFSPHTTTGESSPQLVSSPLSTIGDLSLSPLQHPRAYSFDLGFLNAQQPTTSAPLSQHQLLSTVPEQLPLKTSIAPSSSSVTFESPPHSAGLAAPIPLNPTQQQPITPTSAVNYEQLLALAQLLSLNQQQPPISLPQQPPQLFSTAPFVPTPAQPQMSLQDIVSLASLLIQNQQQQQQQKLPETHTSAAAGNAATNNNNNNNYIDILSV